MTLRILSYEDLATLKGVKYSKVQLWRLEKLGKFPKRVPVGPARHGWLETEIDAYLRRQIEARDKSMVAA
ncbi:MAG: AlpA family phage regulatory protein [Pseudorhodoplanes sp.]|jgi:prophage regulatory protein|nr:AlpA family phage regulatory protein [Pseudorhodoplanes sp.]